MVSIRTPLRSAAAKVRWLTSPKQTAARFARTPPEGRTKHPKSSFHRTSATLQFDPIGTLAPALFFDPPQTPRLGALPVEKSRLGAAPHANRVGFAHTVRKPRPHQSRRPIRLRTHVGSGQVAKRG